jgi:peptidoglycan/xylan/chitin deacetylase (PgdA/CDA1 family)
MRLALKIDVDTLRGTREGVPTLVDLLRKHGVTATFLFSLGPDHTGRAIKRVFRPGFLGKVRRTSVVKHYGVRTLLYGTVLPGPDIGRRAADVMQGVRDAGHETGVHCWDHIRWQDGVMAADDAWTYKEMHRACERYTEIFREPPRTHGAAGWQMNVHALRMTQRLGFDYCSDGRGTHPHLPIWNAEPVRCPQFPTTLPTLDELVGLGDVTEDNVAAHLLERTRDAAAAPAGHVFTLHAELEGMRLAPAFEQLILGWKAQGFTLGPVRMLFDTVEPMALPRCATGPGTVPGRTGTLLVQGEEFLGNVDLARAA